MGITCQKISRTGAALLLMVLTGCGGAGNHAAVHGRVNLDGQPLAKGTIRFLPAQGGAGMVSGGDIVNGEYVILATKGPNPGTSRVEIQSMRPTGRKFHDPMLPAGQMAEEFEPAVAAAA